MTFLRAVGSFGERCGPARELSAVLAAVRPNTNIDTLPREVSILMKQAVAAAGIRRKELARIRGVSEGSAAFALKFSPSRTLVAEYADILDNSELRSGASSDLFWDRVVAIEADRNEEVFDLTVPGPTSWLADGIVNHNSGAIEQDSDIVMFIHREDSDDPTVKGRADLIVAKHRNGPTANIPLTFLPHLTLFRNFART